MADKDYLSIRVLIPTKHRFKAAAAAYPTHDSFQVELLDVYDALLPLATMHSMSVSDFARTVIADALGEAEKQ